MLMKVLKLLQGGVRTETREFGEYLDFLSFLIRLWQNYHNYYIFLSEDEK